MIGGGAGATPTPLAAGTDNFVLRMGSANPGYEEEVLSFNATITSPTTSEDASLFYTPVAITFTEIRCVVVGTSSPSLTMEILHDTDRSAAGTTLSASNAYNNETVGEVGALTDATVPTDSYVWIETTADVGTVSEIQIHMRYTID